MERKPLPVGIDNFEKLIRQGYYYVDKTLLIKELMDKKGEVNLFTRPRRFGKSLNISMVQHFFEKTDKNNASLFKGLKIMNEGERYTSEMGRYPMIKLTLKSVDGPTFNSAMYRLKGELSNEFIRHRYLLESSKLGEETKRLYQNITNRTATNDEYVESLRLLSQCLATHHGEKAVILIDEYDVPLEKAHFNGYYRDMIEVVRSLFGMALKTNGALHFAMLTGCLRISKESIFTGLNNLNVISITSDEYEEYFGFTEAEVEDALSYYGRMGKLEEAREWYNGYIFGKTNVYNPWSVIMYLKEIVANANCYPSPHWSNTSSNGIIRELITLADEEAKSEIEELIQGGCITKPIHEDIVYSEIRESMDNLWNFLFFTGYLKKTCDELIGRKKYVTLKIPNEEVRYIYENKIEEWFKEKTTFHDPAILLNAILEQDADVLTSELNKRLMDTISYFDGAEAFYHGFLLGILSNVRGFAVKSNRETRLGRTDIFMKETGIRKRGVIFELKVMVGKSGPEETCEEALRQIEEKRYAHELEEEGYRGIIKYGIAFRGKECMVKAGSD